MKPKYKIGTLVEVPAGHGIVNSVITFSDGYKYGLDGNPLNDAVPESEVLKAYKPVVARKIRKAKKVQVVA